MSKTPLVGSSFFGLDLSKVVDRFWTFRRRVSKRFLLLEFGSTALTLAEATLDPVEVQFDHIRRVELPDTAVERGVPTEPKQMAALLRELCKEERIPAHRAAVVLPPEAAFSKLVALPAALTPGEARAYVADPSSGVQIPIPLQQTDFDLVPAGLPSADQDQRLYFLTSVPQKLVEQLLDCLHQAHLELHALDLAPTAQQRLLVNESAGLLEQERLLLLDLTKECSHLTVLTAQGEVLQERLAAIREFPDPIRTVEASDAALGEGLTAEAMVQADASYLPISELDIRVLVRELKQSMASFEARYGARWKGMALTGVSSAHPLIAELLHHELCMPVRVLRPQAATGVGGVRFKQLMVQQSLTRLMGLGLRLLPVQLLNACALDRSDHEAFPPLPPAPPAVLTAELEPIEQVELEVNKHEEEEAGEPRLPSESEEWPSIQQVSAEASEPAIEEALVKSVELEEKEEGSGIEGIGELRLPSESEEWPSIQRVSAEASEPAIEEAPVKSVELEEKEEGIGIDGIGELRLPSESEEWPSIQRVSAEASEPAIEEALVKSVELEEKEEGIGIDGIGELRLPSESEEWPSIQRVSAEASEPAIEEALVKSVELEEKEEGIGIDGIGELRLPSESEEWPSIQRVSAEASEPAIEEALVKSVELEEKEEGIGIDGIGELRLPSESEEWPSIQRDV